MYNQIFGDYLFGRDYSELLYNNFIRFIGDNFTALTPEVCQDFLPQHCVKQSVHGDFEVNSFISMDTETALAFASHYADDNFTEYDEYVQASIEDFLNLHNGLFIVNASNNRSTELNIGILEAVPETPIHFEKPALRFPVRYPFGLVNYVVEIIHIAA